MKVGDLVKVKECAGYVSNMPGVLSCECFFCAGNSNRIGIVLGPAPRNSWAVMFDCGERCLDDFEEARGEVEVVSESRRSR